jgi:hypothetical protein
MGALMRKADQEHLFESGPRCGCAVGSCYARKLVRPIGLEPITFGSGEPKTANLLKPREPIRNNLCRCDPHR